MSPPDLASSCEGDVEINSSEVQGTVSQDDSHADLASQPLDLRVVKNRDSNAEECALPGPNFARRSSAFLNAPLMKNMPKPIAEVKPFSSITAIPEDLTNAKSLQVLNPAAPPMEIVPADPPIQQSMSKAALKFCLKKCGEFSLYFRSSSKKVVAPTNCRFRSLLTSLKNTVRSLAKSVPSTNVINRIHNSVISKIKEKRMQDCLKFSLSFIPFNRRKKIRAVDSLAPMQLGAQAEPNETTYVNPSKKPELEHLAGFPFAKPKFYECSYCDTRFYKLPIYIKHIRRHAEIIRCDTCCKAFSSLINKRRHMLQCHQRPIV